MPCLHMRGPGRFTLHTMPTPSCTPNKNFCKKLPILYRDTEIPDDMIRDFLEDVAPRFNAGTYDLLSNNCNTFADALCEFLVGKGIPVRVHLLDNCMSLGLLQTTHGICGHALAGARLSCLFWYAHVMFSGCQMPVRL